VKGWVLAVLGIGASCAGTPRRGDTGIRALGFDLWDVHCPSGMRVIFERATGANMVGVTTVVGVGSRADPPGREGLAHVVEHLAFRGHEADQPEIDDRLGALGGLHNAFTNFDETTYYELAPTASLQSLLALEGERLLAPLDGVDDETFFVEREVVRNELRERNESDSRGLGVHGVEQVVFPGSHPYARPIIGTHESLSALTLADARAFVTDHYRPAEMTMVVIGDVDLTHAESLLRQALPPALYGDPAHVQPVAAPGARMPAAAAPPAPPPAPATLLRLPAEVATRELWIGWTTPGGFGPERFIGEMWAGLLRQNLHSARFDDADIAGVEVFSHPGALATVFGCRVKLTVGDHPEKSLKEVISSMPWIGDDEIYLDQRFEHLKAWSLQEMVFDAESTETRGRDRAEYAHFTGSVGYMGRTVAAIQSITTGQARDFATRYLAGERARAVLLEPMAGDPAAIVANAGGPAKLALAPAAELSPPALAPLQSIRFLRDLRRVTLPNGLETIIIRRPGASVVTAALGVHGGADSAGLGVGAASRYAMKMYFEESPGDFGIEVGFGSFPDQSMIAATAGAGNLDRALAMVAFALRSYDVEWPDDKFRDTILPFIKRQEGGAVERFEHSYRDALYRGHPSGVSPTGEQIAATKKGEIAGWLERALNPRNALLVIAGDVDPKQVEADAREAFAAWKPAGGVVAPPAPFPASAPATAGGGPLDRPDGFLVVHRPAATQVLLRMGCLLPPGDARTDALRDVAAGIVGNRLQSVLRWRMGSTYGVQVGAVSRRGAGTVLQISASFDNASFPAAWSELQSAFDSSSWSTLATKESVAFAAGSLASDRLRANERSASLATAVLDAWNAGWPLDSPDQYIGDLASITPAEVNATLAQCAAGTEVALLGDEPTIRAATAVHRRSVQAAAPAASGPSP
jgi:zinc protease